MNILLDKPPISRIKKLTKSVKSAPNLLLWLKADGLRLSNGDLVSSWTDFSGNNFHATGSDASRPTYQTNVINGRPVIRFNGSQGRQLDTSNEASFDLSAFTIYAVAQRSSGNTLISKNSLIANATRRKLQFSLSSSSAFGFAAGNDGASITENATTTSFNIYGVVGRANNDHDLILNGAVNNKTTTLDNTSFNNARVEIGQSFNNGSERFTGDIAEILVYGAALSLAQRRAIEKYLSVKYAIAVT